MRFGVLDQLAEILEVEAGFHRRSRTGIDQVVARLGTVDGSRIDHTKQCLSLAESSYPVKSNLTLGVKDLKSFNYLYQHIVHTEQVFLRVSYGGHPVMELDQVHRRPVHAPQAFVNRSNDSSLDVTHIFRTQAHLGAYVNVSR